MEAGRRAWHELRAGSGASFSVGSRGREAIIGWMGEAVEPLVVSWAGWQEHLPALAPHARTLVSFRRPPFLRAPLVPLSCIYQSVFRGFGRTSSHPQLRAFERRPRPKPPQYGAFWQWGSDE